MDNLTAHQIAQEIRELFVNPGETQNEKEVGHLLVERQIKGVPEDRSYFTVLMKTGVIVQVIVQKWDPSITEQDKYPLPPIPEP